MSRQPGYQFSFPFRPPEFHVVIRDEKDVMELPLEWAFGAGRQAITFVSHVDKDWYVEHFPTYYPSIHDYRPTPGQGDLKPDSLPHAAGVLYKTADPASGIAKCFECHSTGPVTFDSAGAVHVTELGVRCESCHGPGGAHAKNPKVPVSNPRNLSAATLNEFCGRCHRPPVSDGSKVDFNYAWNVRHQPIYLNESRCFQKSTGALSCLNCHDPHESIGEKSIAAYSRECQRCHTAERNSPKPVCVADRSNHCVNCHMPLVSPQPPLRFTNHWIGIYRNGSKLKPVR